MINNELLNKIGLIDDSNTKLLVKLLIESILEGKSDAELTGILKNKISEIMEGEDKWK